MVLCSRRSLSAGLRGRNLPASNGSMFFNLLLSVHVDGLYSTGLPGGRGSGCGQVRARRTKQGYGAGRELLRSCVCHGLGGTGTKPFDNMGRLARGIMQSSVNVHACMRVYVRRARECLFSYIRASGCFGRRFDLLHQWNPPIHLLDNKAGSKKLTRCSCVRRCVHVSLLVTVEPVKVILPAGPSP